MFEYRRVDFLFVLTAVKFWLQIGWGKGFHELSSNERTTHVTVDARTARSNRRSKITWQSYFFGNHWQIDNHWHIFGWLQKLTIFGRMNIQDLYHVLGGFNHLQKLNISENPEDEHPMPHCRTATGCSCRVTCSQRIGRMHLPLSWTDEADGRPGNEGNESDEGNIIPLYPTKNPHIICSMVKSWIGHIKWDGQASPFPGI